MVIRRFVSADAVPVHRLGRELGIGITLDDLGITTFGFCPILPHDCHAGETHFEIGSELFLRQITFEPPPFFAFGIHDEYSRRPQRFESVKVFGILLNVNPERDEVFVDE